MDGNLYLRFPVLYKNSFFKLLWNGHPSLFILYVACSIFIILDIYNTVRFVLAQREGEREREKERERERERERENYRVS